MTLWTPAERRHGLQRCRYRGMDGTARWVGLGVIADNLIIARFTLDVQPHSKVAEMTRSDTRPAARHTGERLLR